jgi:hypothetical protein
MAFGHLENLNIKGGETFTGGQNVNITWEVGHNHNQGIGIHFSRQGNNVWTLVAQVADNCECAKSYTWKVPDSATSQGKIRVWQMNSPASNTANSTNLISGAFTISGATPILALRKTEGARRQGVRLVYAGIGFGKVGPGVLPNGKRVSAIPLR